MISYSDLNINKFTLSFPEPLESEYQKYFFKESLKVFRITFPIVVSLIGVFGLLDLVLEPELANNFLSIRFFFMIPFLSIVYIISFFKIYEKFWLALLIISYMVASFGISLMIMQLPPHHSYYMGLMHILATGYFIIGLPFRYATLGGWLTLIILNILMLGYTNVDYPIVLSYNMFYVTANLINMFASYSIELYNRKNYVLNNHLTLERENLEDEVRRRTDLLEKSEKKYRRLVEDLSDAIFTLDSEGKITFISPVIERITGLSTIEYLGRDFITLIEKKNNSTEQFEEYFEKHSNQTTTFLADYYIDNKKMEKIWIRITLRKNENEYLGTVRDITEMKRADLALKEKNDLLQSISDNMFDKIAVCDMQGDYKYAYNSKRLLGFDESYLIGKNALSFIHPEDFERISAQLMEMLTSEEGKTIAIYRHLNNEGKYTWLETVGRLIYDEQGNKKEILFCSRDISERKAAEEILKESEEKYRIIVEHSSDLVWSLDLNGIFQYASPSWEHVTGHSPNDITGKGFADFIRESDLSMCWKFFNDTVERGTKDVYLEYKLRHTDGNYYWHEATISPVMDKDDKVISIVGVCRNIQERKEWEEKLKRFNEKLERKVEERTEELNETLSQLENANIELQQMNENIRDDAEKLLALNESLIISEQELNRANKTKDKFLSILAHDINNPIQSLVLSSHLLLNHRLQMTDFDINEKLMSLSGTAYALSDLVKSIVNWARAQSKNIEFEPIEMPLEYIVDDILRLLKNNLETKGIKVLHPLISDKLVNADENMLSTIIRNLISNAIKFTPKNGTIEVGVAGDDENEILIFVKDNGIGMEKAILDRLFNAEDNIKSVGTEGEPGTGLGLIICKEFVEKHGGRIWAESEVGKGSTFYFTLSANLHRVHKIIG